MDVAKKQNQVTYFKFFFSILRLKFFLNIALNVAIGLLDGLGLTMLIPLLQSMEGNGSSGKSLGQLQYIVTFFESLGFPLTINVILSIFLILFALKAVLKYVASLYQIKIQNFFVLKLQKQLISDLQAMSFKGYLQFDAGKLQNVIIEEVWRISEAMKRYMRWNQSLLMLSTYVCLAFLANPQFAVLIGVGVGLSNLLYRKFFNRIRAASYQISQRGQKLSGYLIEFVHHFKYLKSTGYIGRFSKKLKGVVKEGYDLNYSLGKNSSLVASLKEPMVVFIVVSVIFVQVNWVRGEVGSIMLSLLLFYRGLNHLLSLQNEWQSFLHYSGAFRMVYEMKEQIGNHREVTGSVRFQSFNKEINVENVSLSFGNNKVLDQVNLRVLKNNTIAIVGTSGAGKTTLINIISGLLKPDAGRIMIDGVDLSNYSLDDYRSKIGYISQESVIFNDTLYNNVTFWAEPTEENLKQFWNAVKMSSLTEFVDLLEAKENTPLGDNGILISGGQRQRISIARELYKDPKILIFDEATSALDSETESLIQENIERLHGSYTMIIIAHRLSTIKKADTIYLLEKGDVSAAGTFGGLIETSDKFRKMVSLQKVFH
jgi:subfamily B ATP-binding cassette protein MsbA